MKKLEIFKNKLKIHFVGIGGVSMSAIAKYCRLVGVNVSGSDVKRSESITRLSELGVKIFIGHKAENVLGASAVVYNGAIDKDNAEIVQAKELNIPLISRSELLGAILAEYKNSVGIAGSHGKTTATAMLAHIFSRADLSPVAFIGGEDYEFGNFLCGNGEVVITEACEFKRSFLNLKPSVAVALNIDNDHLDCYGSMENLALAFKEYLSAPIAVINADDERLSHLADGCAVTFGIKKNSAYTAKKIVKNRFAGYSFYVYRSGIKLGRINLKIMGRHNVYNALSAVATAGLFGISFSTIKKALENFHGVQRRMERLGTLYKMQAFADYAHHPKEISASLSAFMNENSVAVFQPHTYSRTRLLMPDFIETLKKFDNIIIYATYPAREEFDAKGSAYALYREIKKTGSKVGYASTPKELFYKLKKLSLNKKRVIFVGAGDIYDIATEKIDGKNRK